MRSKLFGILFPLSILSLSTVKIRTSLNLQFDHEDPMNTIQSIMPTIVEKEPSPIAFPPEQSMAVCLVISDDNMILPEWLAYHYTTLPLRYLLLANDPRSKTSPLEVLERWNQTDLKYWIWDDSDFFTPRNYEKKAKIQSLGKWDDHRRLVFRQDAFIPKCNAFFKKLNLTWVGHFDVDEFVAMNRVGRYDTNFFRKQLRYSPNLKKTKSIVLKDYTWGEAVRWRKKIIPDDPMSNDTVHSLLERARVDFKAKNCIEIPRWRHGTVETKSCPKIPQDFKTIDVSRLETFRFVQGSDPSNFTVNRYGKGILDVSALKETRTKTKGPHVPSRHLCPDSKVPYIENPLILLHYVGTWERYSARQDARRTPETWKQESQNVAVADSCDKKVQTWLPKFVQQVGRKRAAFLLGHSNSTL